MKPCLINTLQVYQPGKGLDFHFDKDEALMKEKNQMRHPVLSSILYLSGDRNAPRLGKIFHVCFSQTVIGPCLLT